MTSSWQSLRAEFNHNWFIRYLNRLDGFIARIEKSNLDENRLYDFLNTTFTEWRDHREDAHWLIDDFIDEMSPRRLFEDPPLSRCSDEMKFWLKDLVHLLWLNRYPIHSWLLAAKKGLEKADQEFQVITHNLGKNSRIEIGRVIEQLPAFRNFRESCLELSKAFSNLPGDYLVT